MNELKSIKIAVDALPYKNTLQTVCDYSGEQIFLKTGLPLFKENGNKLINLAASFYEISDSGKVIKIQLRKNLYWHNNENVTADDYCRAIKCILRDKTNRYKSLFFDIENARDYSQFKTDAIGINSYKRYQIIIKLKYKNNFFLYFLTLINTSPLHISNFALTAGPYFIKNNSEHNYILERNKYYQLASPDDTFDNITYSLIQRDDNASQYHLGKVDVSCDTGLNLFHYKVNQKQQNFHQNDTKLMIMLTPGNIFNDVPDKVKEIIRVVINRDDINKFFSGILINLYSYLQIYDSNYVISVDKTEHDRLNEAFNLKISYEDFYPNKMILELIGSQLKNYNIQVTLLKDEYGKWNSEGHLRFEIRKSLKNTPILLLKSDLSKGIIPEATFQQVLKYYSILLQTDNADEQTLFLKKIDDLLLQHCTYIPLFIMPTGYFCREYINHLSLMSVGEYIQVAV